MDDDGDDGDDDGGDDGDDGCDGDGATLPYHTSLFPSPGSLKQPHQVLPLSHLASVWTLISPTSPYHLPSLTHVELPVFSFLRPYTSFSINSLTHSE